MVEPKINISEIAGLLKPYREIISTEWANLILEELPFSEYTGELRANLYRDTLVWVDALFQTMTRIHEGRRGSHWSPSSYLEDLPGENFNLSDFVCAWRLISMRVIKNLSLPVMWPSLPIMHAPQLDTVVRQVYRSTKQKDNLTVGSYVTEAMRKMEVQRSRNALLLEAARAASNSLSLNAILATTGRGIAAAADVQGCMFYLVDEEDNLVAKPGFVELDGIAKSAEEQINKNLSKALDKVIKPILDRVREQGVPLTYDNTQVDSPIEWVEPLGEAKSFLAVPCSYNGILEAIAVSCSFNTEHRFTVEETELSWGIANVIAPAIANARLHEKVKSLAAREERVRLAQEMHDTLAQVLATLSLKADVAINFLGENQREDIKANLQEMKSLADDGFSMVREEIFSLRGFDSFASRWLQTLQKYLEDYRIFYGLDVRLLIQDESATTLSDTTSIQVFRIIQEALTNVRRHARATQAWVSFQRRDTGIYFEIGDDGIGFDLNEIIQKNSSHYGLAIMRERAESVGGWLTLQSQPGEATRVKFWVPVIEQKGI